MHCIKKKKAIGNAIIHIMINFNLVLRSIPSFLVLHDGNEPGKVVKSVSHQGIHAAFRMLPE